VSRGQCVDRRIADRAALNTEIRGETSTNETYGAGYQVAIRNADPGETFKVFVLHRDRRVCSVTIDANV
jgi:hypothetical protein